MTVLYRLLLACLLWVGPSLPITAKTETMVLIASWYGPGFHGNRMANGQLFNMHDPHVAAHRYYTFGTCLRLTNPETGRDLLVQVQDRGPYVHDRHLDVSRAAAVELGIIEQGVARLQVQKLPKWECTG